MKSELQSLRSAEALAKEDLPMDAAKPSIPAITNPIQFIKEVITELKKVTWPTREETMKLTVVVIVLSVLVGAFVGSLDITFLKITTLLFRK